MFLGSAISLPDKELFMVRAAKSITWISDYSPNVMMVLATFFQAGYWDNLMIKDDDRFWYSLPIP